MAWENDASGKAYLLKAVVQLRVTKTARLNHSQIGRAPRGGALWAKSAHGGSESHSRTQKKRHARHERHHKSVVKRPKADDLTRVARCVIQPKAADATVYSANWLIYSGYTQGKHPRPRTRRRRSCSSTRHTLSVVFGT